MTILPDKRMDWLIVVGLFIGLVGPRFLKSINWSFILNLSWALYAVGFVLFLSAKLSIIKKGKFFTFGPASMTSQNKKFYLAGYVCMFIGGALTLVLLVIPR